MSQAYDLPASSASLSSSRLSYNNTINAARTANSGTTAPTSPELGREAYTMWADTTTAVMKIRNAADDGWIPLYDLANGIVNTCGGSYQFTLAAASYSTEAEVPILVVPFNATLLTAKLVSSKTTASSDGSNKWLSSILNKTEGVDISSADLNTDTTELTAFAAQSYALTAGNTDLASGDVITGTIQSVGSPTTLQHFSWLFQLTFTLR